MPLEKALELEIGHHSANDAHEAAASEKKRSLTCAKRRLQRRHLRDPRGENLEESGSQTRR